MQNRKVSKIEQRYLNPDTIKYPALNSVECMNLSQRRLSITEQIPLKLGKCSMSWSFMLIQKILIVSTLSTLLLSTTTFN